MVRQLAAAGLLALLLAAADAVAGPAYQLQVKGLACPFCAYGIEKQLRKIEGVEEIEVEIGAGVVLVRMQDGAALSRERAAQAVRKAGFELGGFAEADSPA